MTDEQGKKGAAEEQLPDRPATSGTPSIEPADGQVEPAVPQAEAAGDVDTLRGKLEEAQKAAEAYKDQLLRKAADFENYKRRVEADFANLIRSANEGLIASLLPILDDLIRSLRLGKEQKDYEAFYKGVELIHAKLARILEGHGLAPFESAGKPFDVDYHDALLQVPRNDVAPHTVIEEVERGYKLHDKVLRHAKVIVSGGPGAPSEPPTDSTNGDNKEDDRQE